MYAIILIIMILTPSICYATADIRISDKDGHILDINSDGSITVTETNDGAGENVSGVPDIRISDDDGDIMGINTDGSLTIKEGSPS